KKKVTKPGGETVFVDQSWIYEGFSRRPETSPESGQYVCGTILLEIPGVEPGLNRQLTAARITELGEQENNRRPENYRVRVDHFDKILDLEKDLYRDYSLKVNPKLSKASFHFRHGTLYSIFPASANPVEFFPEGSGARDSDYPTEIGLEIEVPEGRY